MQQRQQEIVSEYKLALKVLASIGPKIKELEFKTANIAGMEFTWKKDESHRPTVHDRREWHAHGSK